MLLATLIGPGTGVSIDGSIPPIDVLGLTADSRAVKPGYVFAALSGSRSDGARFAADAVSKGAVAVLAASSADIDGTIGVPVLRALEPRRALALIATRFYGRQPQTALAITGTNGKTSVAEFTRQILAACGLQAASLGTIGLVKPDGGVYGSLTTPDPVTLHATLADLADEGVTHLAFEASSHGLDQHRLDGVRLTAAAFTNIGRDHLDYHPTPEAYFEAKLRLFSELLPADATAVVNCDGPGADRVIAVASERGLRLITTGEKAGDVRIDAIQRQGFGQALRITAAGTTREVTLPLVGSYQASNAALAAGLAIAAGVPAADAVAAIARIQGVKGRLEIVAHPNGGIAVVDYAHKPEALEAALAALRPFATGRLICVFGCGGDRDRGKRPIMGQIAATHADAVIVTDDNPRTEVPASIRSEILGGIAAGRDKVREIADRAEAIQAAIAMMSRGDVLLVAGKGHESGQIIGTVTVPFSDHEAIVAALAGGRHV
jgi:UDP-N-acetylmuramoyl-L-alanyl-D-glutamate--2,6-diaminopimelate ligase